MSALRKRPIKSEASKVAHLFIRFQQLKTQTHKDYYFQIAITVQYITNNISLKCGTP